MNEEMLTIDDLRAPVRSGTIRGCGGPVNVLRRQRMARIDAVAVLVDAAAQRGKGLNTEEQVQARNLQSEAAILSEMIEVEQEKDNAIRRREESYAGIYLS